MVKRVELDRGLKFVNVDNEIFVVEELQNFIQSCYERESQHTEIERNGEECVN